MSQLTRCTTECSELNLKNKYCRVRSTHSDDFVGHLLDDLITSKRSKYLICKKERPASHVAGTVSLFFAGFGVA